MDIETYQKSCKRTYPSFEQDLQTEKRIGRIAILLHAHLGISSEAGEFADAIKKYCIYGKPLDIENLVEELGDLLWYISLASDALNYSIPTIMEMNINKLRIRYPEKFTEQDALERKDKIDFTCVECGCKDGHFTHCLINQD